MTPENFKSWRKSMGLNRSDTAELLGKSKRKITAFEKSVSGEKYIIIPKSVELACYALSRGVSEFDGKTAKNSFNGLGAAEEIKMMKTKNQRNSGKAK